MQGERTHMAELCLGEAPHNCLHLLALFQQLCNENKYIYIYTVNSYGVMNCKHSKQKYA